MFRDKSITPALFCMLFFIAVLISAPSVFAEQITFSGKGSFFSAEKKNAEFKYRDNLGEQTLAIKKCNEKLLLDFWSQLTRPIKSLQYSKRSFSNKKRRMSSITFNGIKQPVLDLEPANLFYLHVPTRIHSVFIESERLCRSKS
jgi:hypothetical protein